MSKWIRKKGTLKIDGKTTLKYGDDIPKDFPKKRLAKLKELGYIGDILENIAEHPEVRALKAQISRRDKKVEDLEATIEKLQSRIEDMGKEKDPPPDPEDDEGGGE